MRAPQFSTNNNKPAEPQQPNLCLFDFLTPREQPYLKK